MWPYSAESSLHYLCVSINGNLFPRPSRRAAAPNDSISDLEYADDAMFCESSREASTLALTAFDTAAREFGLSINFSKTKFMVAGYGIGDADREDLQIGGAVVTHVSSFIYLGSVLTPDARSAADIRRRIALASSAFGSLRSVLLDDHLSLATRRWLYSACVLMVLLCGAECWAPLGTGLRRLDAFHHQCLYDTLVLSRKRRKSERITHAQLRLMLGDTISISDRVRHCQLEWLGHVVRMEDARLPKRLLFSSLPFPRPACGPHLLWKDVVSRHLVACVE